MTSGAYGASGQSGEADTTFPLLPSAIVNPSIPPRYLSFCHFSTDCGLTEDLLCHVMGWQESWPLRLAFPHTHPVWCGGYAQPQGALSQVGYTCASSLSGSLSLSPPPLFYKGRPSVLLTPIKSSQGLPALQRQKKKKGGKVKLDFIFMKQ